MTSAAPEMNPADELPDGLGLGRYLAAGLAMEKAIERCSPRNWMLRTAIHHLREARDRLNEAAAPFLRAEGARDRNLAVRGARPSAGTPNDRVAALAASGLYELHSRDREYFNRVRHATHSPHDLALAWLRASNLEWIVAELLRKRRARRRFLASQLRIDFERVLAVQDNVVHVQFAKQVEEVPADAPTNPSLPDDGGRSVRHSSESAEFYTPPEIVEAALDVLGEVDVDPASSEVANRIIGAASIFTSESNGLDRSWEDSKGGPARVFLNPPGGKSDDAGRRVVKDCEETGACGLPPGHKHVGPAKSSVARWWRKLIDEGSRGHVQAAIWVGFSLEQLQSLQSARLTISGDLRSPLDFTLCFPSKRIAYLREVGGRLERADAPPHASYIALYLPNPMLGSGLRERFRAAFSPLGRVLG